MEAGIPNQRVLNGLASRVERFATASVVNPAIFRALRAVGYSTLHHRRGLDLLVGVLSYVEGVGSARLDEVLVGLLTRADDLDDVLLTRLEGALGILWPAQREALIGGLTASTGLGAVANLKIIVGRYEGLAASEAEGDREAVVALGERGLDGAYMAEVKALVAQIEGFELAAEPPSGEELRRRQIALYAWYREWSNNARRVIKRRDWLISLGLARRRRTASGQEEVVLIGEDEEAEPLEPTREEPSPGGGS